MRKDASKVREYAKHTRNAGGYGKRGVNKRVRRTSSKPYTKRAKSPREVPVHYSSSPPATTHNYEYGQKRRKDATLLCGHRRRRPSQRTLAAIGHTPYHTCISPIRSPLALLFCAFLRLRFGADIHLKKCVELSTHVEVHLHVNILWRGRRRGWRRHGGLDGHG